MRLLFAIFLIAISYADVSQARATKAEQPFRSVNHFNICGQEKRLNCVVDGDTIWFRGEKIRLADIDTPETMHSKCAYEKRLGKRASLSLLTWINQGSFKVIPSENAKDRYGRTLASLFRSGNSAGDMMIAKGLARKWDGKRESWCKD